MRDSEIRIGGEVFARISGRVTEAFFATVSYRLEPRGGERVSLPFSMTFMADGFRRSGCLWLCGSWRRLKMSCERDSVEKVMWDFQDLRPRDDAGQAVNDPAENAQEYISLVRGMRS